jgi:hypothetical protein
MTILKKLCREVMRNYPINRRILRISFKLLQHNFNRWKTDPPRHHISLVQLKLRSNDGEKYTSRSRHVSRLHSTDIMR